MKKCLKLELKKLIVGNDQNILGRWHFERVDQFAANHFFKDGLKL